MPRGRSYSWASDQSNGPVIIEREPDVRTTRPTRPHKQPKKLTFGFKFVNPFKSRKPSVRIVHREVHRRRRRADRPDVVETRERNQERRRSEESTSMSRGGRPDEFVPLPPRIPIHYPDPDPIIEVVSPRRTQRAEVHQPGRNSFDLPMNRSPVRPSEPERIIARERDRRRDADRLARHETRRRREAEEEAERVRRAAARERERRRQVEEITQRIGRVAINERENRREAEEEARRLAAEAQEAEARARQAEYALARERQLAERERAVRERQRQAEREDRAEAEAEALTVRRRPVHVVQRDLPLVVDRGAEVLRQAQEAERRRRDDDLLYRMERDRHRDLPRRQRSITIFEDDDDRRRHRRS
jgi:hypothetical protein